MKVTVKVRLKKSILDTQGKTVNQALHQLGFKDISQVRIGKLIEMEVDDRLDPEAARKIAGEAANKLLANTVIEDYEIDFPGQE